MIDCKERLILLNVQVSNSGYGKGHLYVHATSWKCYMPGCGNKPVAIINYVGAGMLCFSCLHMLGRRMNWRYVWIPYAPRSPVYRAVRDYVRLLRRGSLVELEESDCYADVIEYEKYKEKRADGK